MVKSKEFDIRLMPLLLAAVTLAFSVVFTVLLIPVASVIGNLDINVIFVFLLIVTATVSSTVALIFFLILDGRLTGKKR